MKLSTTLVLELEEGLGGVEYDSRHGSRTQFPANRKHNDVDSQIWSPEILEIGTPATLDVYNYLCRT
jgi:hypothetical protein